MLFNGDPLNFGTFSNTCKDMITGGGGFDSSNIEGILYCPLEKMLSAPVTNLNCNNFAGPRRFIADRNGNILLVIFLLSPIKAEAIDTVSSAMPTIYSKLAARASSSHRSK